MRGRDLTYRLVNLLGSGLFRVFRLRISATGTEHVPLKGGAVLAISHFSYLDFALAQFTLWRARRRFTRYLATKAAFDTPVAGWLIRAMGHICVDRRAGGGAYAAAVTALERGEVVGIFPETRLSPSFTLLPFKTGAARMAAQSGRPLVPCVVWGGHRVLTRTRRFSARAAFGTPVLVRFGAPIHVPADADPVAVTASLHATMTELLEHTMSAYPVQPEAGAWWVPAHLGGGAPAPAADERTLPA